MSMGGGPGNGLRFNGERKKIKSSDEMETAF